jgi:hypothetical protein
MLRRAMRSANMIDVNSSEAKRIWESRAETAVKIIGMLSEDERRIRQSVIAEGPQCQSRSSEFAEFLVSASEVGEWRSDIISHNDSSRDSAARSINGKEADHRVDPVEMTQSPCLNSELSSEETE